ncbi:hypothetical protein [Actinoallomurus acaciae]|uniref:Uncharacterized protein n=1 Tax=Actinoallomurus acaciae TaxID=502577 RepID=A0ABV5Y9U5_9ACTN
MDLRIDIEISADGAARLTYRYEVLNMTDRPLTRLSRVCGSSTRAAS